MAKVADGSGTAAPTAAGAAMVSGLPNGIVVAPSDHGPGPLALVAITVNVYVVPLASPVDRCVVVTPTVVICGCPAGGGLTSTEYPMIALPSVGRRLPGQRDRAVAWRGDEPGRLVGHPVGGRQ